MWDMHVNTSLFSLFFTDSDLNSDSIYRISLSSLIFFQQASGRVGGREIPVPFSIFTSTGQWPQGHQPITC